MAGISTSAQMFSQAPNPSGLAPPPAGAQSYDIPRATVLRYQRPCPQCQITCSRAMDNRRPYQKNHRCDACGCQWKEGWGGETYSNSSIALWSHSTTGDVNFNFNLGLGLGSLRLDWVSKKIPRAKVSLGMFGYWNSVCYVVRLAPNVVWKLIDMILTQPLSMFSDIGPCWTLVRRYMEGPLSVFLVFNFI